MTDQDKSRRERARAFQAETGSTEFDLEALLPLVCAFAESEANLARRAALEEAATVAESLYKSKDEEGSWDAFIMGIRLSIGRRIAEAIRALIPEEAR